jgi:hypothetical protein
MCIIDDHPAAHSHVDDKDSASYVNKFLEKKGGVIVNLSSSAAEMKPPMPQR